MSYKKINYHHLHYFYTVAKAGGVTKAAEQLNVSAQTISGQLSVMEEYLAVRLFNRVGRRLVLTEMGHLAFSYAEDIFGLGSELANALQSNFTGSQIVFSVGVVDVIPKVFAFDLLKQSFKLQQDVKLVSREGDFDFLLAEMALNRLDLIISDRPLPPNMGVKAYSHFFGESGFTFFADKTLAKKVKKGFPQSLHHVPFLLPGDKSVQKNNILNWFHSINIHPQVVAEFDDTALMKFFGQDGLGVFCTPSSIEPFVLEQFKLEVVGRITNLKESYYGISPERKVKHPLVGVVFQEAKRLMS